MSRYSDYNAPFWETEKPVVFPAGRNVIRHYPNSGWVVAHQADHVGRDSEVRPGRGVGIDLLSLRKDQQGLDRLIKILEQLIEI